MMVSDASARLLERCVSLQKDRDRLDLELSTERMRREVAEERLAIAEDQLARRDRR